jgi:hypothetical protein
MPLAYFADPLIDFLSHLETTWWITYEFWNDKYPFIVFVASPFP